MTKNLQRGKNSRTTCLYCNGLECNLNYPLTRSARNTHHRLDSPLLCDVSLFFYLDTMCRLDVYLESNSFEFIFCACLNVSHLLKSHYIFMNSRPSNFREKWMTFLHVYLLIELYLAGIRSKPLSKDSFSDCKIIIIKYFQG